MEGKGGDVFVRHAGQLISRNQILAETLQKAHSGDIITREELERHLWKAWYFIEDEERSKKFLNPLAAPGILQDAIKKELLSRAERLSYEAEQIKEDAEMIKAIAESQKEALRYMPPRVEEAVSEVLDETRKYRAYIAIKLLEIYGKQLGDSEFPHELHQELLDAHMDIWSFEDPQPQP